MKEYPQCPSCGGICPQIPPKNFCKRENDKLEQSIDCCKPCPSCAKLKEAVRELLSVKFGDKNGLLTCMDRLYTLVNRWPI